MKIKINPHKNKRLHNKGMKNLKQLILKFNIPLEIIFINGHII
jgi:hypothetical protein